MGDIAWTTFWETTYKTSHGWKQPNQLGSPSKVAAASLSAGERSPKPQVVFVLGGPGSGKGTQCKKISDEFGFVHLSAGDLLRAEVASGSADGTMISEYIREGKIVPVEVTINLLKKAIFSEQDSRYFLIDGFPRNMDNMQGWMRVMEHVVDVPLTLFFDCPEPTMRERLLHRGLTSGRTDDNEKTIVLRFQTFIRESLPVIKALHNLTKVVRISTIPPADAVHKVVRPLFISIVRSSSPTRQISPTQQLSPSRLPLHTLTLSPLARKDRSMVVFVLGAPGAGKTSVCQEMHHLGGWSHICEEEIIHRNIDNATPDGAAFKADMEEGRPVNGDIIARAIADKITPGGKFLVDGFPDTLEKLRGWNELARKDFAVIGMLHLHVPVDVTYTRLSKTSNATAIKKRLEFYQLQIKPVISELTLHGKGFAVDGSRNIDAVVAAVKRNLESMVEVHNPNHHI